MKISKVAGLIFLVILVTNIIDKNSKTNNKQNLSQTTSNQQKIMEEYDILQRLFLNITDKTTLADIQRYIIENGLFYTTRQYSSFSKEIYDYICYQIAYEQDVAKQGRGGKTGSYIKIYFATNRGNVYGNPIHVCYFNSLAFYNDYRKNFEAHYYLVKDNAGHLGYYGHNSDFTVRRGVAYKDNEFVQFTTAKEALDNVLENAKQLYFYY